MSDEILIELGEVSEETKGGDRQPSELGNQPKP
jgi:hypothetical protein